MRRPIATLRRTGLGVRAIAHELGGSPITFGRHRGESDHVSLYVQTS